MDEILHAAGKVRDPVYKVEHAGEQAQEKDTLKARIELMQEALSSRVEQFKQRNARLLHRIDSAVSGYKLRPLPFLALATVIGVAAAVSTVYMPSYVVFVNGERLGVVQSPQVFRQVMGRVEARASEILGYDYTIESPISYEFALTERGQFPATAGFETYLFDQIGEVMKSYVLTVNGTVVGAAMDKASIDQLLESVKAPYVNENTISAEFTAPVVISHEYTPSDIEQDADAMRTMLTANTNGQTTYEVQKGDTFMALAFDNGMSMEEMEALNPDIDVDRLKIGQILNIKEEIPFMSVRTVESVSYTETIASPVEEVEDSSMYQGEKKVLQEGQPGEALITADITYLNGTEQAREINSTTVISEPTTRIVAVGTKERPKTMAKGYFIWPVYGHVTSNYGYRSIFGSYSYHSGIDIASPYGTGIAAADGGTVVWAGWQGSYGNLVIIDHGNGLQTYYGHCSSLLVSVGDKVYQGQTIARVGSTGRSTGNHCHFQVKNNGTTVSPYSYLP